MRLAVKDYAQGYGSSAERILTSVNVIIASLILIFGYIFEIMFE
jgi:hypothetical protein